MKKPESYKSHQRALIVVIFPGIFARIAALKVENDGPTVSAHDPCLSFPSLVTEDRKQFQNLNSLE